MSHKVDLANNLDPDQTPHNAASDMGVHSLSLNNIELELLFKNI